MKTPFTCHILIPEDLRENPLFQIPEGIKQELTCEYYQTVSPKMMECGHAIQLVVLHEEAFESWRQFKIPQKLTTGVFLLDGETGKTLPSSEVVMAWVNPATISKRRWNYLFQQCLHRLEKRREMSLMDSRIKRREQQMKELNEIGLLLSSERDLKKLLHLVVSKSIRLTSADGGALYLLEPIPENAADPDNFFANKELKLQVLNMTSRDVSQEHVLSIQEPKHSLLGQSILKRTSINIEDVYQIPPDSGIKWYGQEFDRIYNYTTRSVLTVPMFNHRQEAVGVIQLINCKNDVDQILDGIESVDEAVQAFEESDAKAMESVASQAAIALENAELFDSIQILFDGFINASVKAIESRDPTTSGHSSRVATLTIALAEAAHQLDSGPFGSLRFTHDQMNEIRYASLLHDFGKIGVQERVLVKSKKLYPEEEQAVMDRFRMIRQGIELEMTKKQLEYFMAESKEDALAKYGNHSQELKEKLDELDDALKFIIKANEPTVLAQGGFERLQDIGRKLFQHPSGIQTPYLNGFEVGSLSVPKGSLNEKDRQEIESHVTHTFNFLSIIPWSDELSRVPDIAYAHHEKLDGSGYPRKLNADQIPVQAKMMTIADIYDALTAWDRPYKKSMPPERALNILGFEAKDKHVDQDLLDLFIDAKLYQLVSRPKTT